MCSFSPTEIHNRFVSVICLFSVVLRTNNLVTPSLYRHTKTCWITINHQGSELMRNFRPKFSKTGQRGEEVGRGGGGTIKGLMKWLQGVGKRLWRGEGGRKCQNWPTAPWGTRPIICISDSLCMRAVIVLPLSETRPPLGQWKCNFPSF